MALHIPTWIARQRLALGGAALLALGAIGGAGAVSLTRPAVEMAPTVATPIARLASTSGIVTVRGRVAEAYGDRFVIQDGTGKALVAAGRGGDAAVAVGSAVTVQGRFDDGQLRARFLVDGSGQVREVGPGGPGRRGPHGRGGGHGPHGAHGPDAPPPPGETDDDGPAAAPAPAPVQPSTPQR